MEGGGGGQWLCGGGGGEEGHGVRGWDRRVGACHTCIIIQYEQTNHLLFCVITPIRSLPDRNVDITL